MAPKNHRARQGEDCRNPFMDYVGSVLPSKFPGHFWPNGTWGFPKLGVPLKGFANLCHDLKTSVLHGNCLRTKILGILLQIQSLLPPVCFGKIQPKQFQE